MPRCKKKKEKKVDKRSHIKTKKTEDPQEIEDSSFPDRSCFTVHVCVVLHLHIEGVLSKRALAGEGWGGGRGNIRSKVKRMTEVKQVNGEQPHFWTLVLAAERRPLHSDLKWLRIAPQLGITCSSTVFLQMKIFYFCLSTLVFFFFFFPSHGFLTQFLGRFCGFKMAGQTPTGRFIVITGRRGLWQNTIERPLGLFVCIFCTCVCAHVCVYAWLSVLGCAGVSSCTQVYCTIQLPLFATVEN